MSKTDENPFSSSKIDILHTNYKQNYLHYKKFIDFIEKLKKVYLNFSDSIEQIFSKNFSFKENQPNSLSPLLINLECHIKWQSSEFNKLAKYISKEIIDNFKLLKESNDKVEEKIYKELSELNKSLRKSKKILEESHNIYNIKMKNLEKLILEEKSTKKIILSSNQEIKDKRRVINEMIIECKNDEIKYEKMIDEVNSKLEKVQEKETVIIGFYKISEQNRINKMNDNVQILLNSLKDINNKINTDIDALLLKTRNFQIQDDILSFEKLVEKHYKIEKKFEFEAYKPNANLDDSLRIFDKKSDDVCSINYEIITLLQKHFKNICSNVNMKEEKRRYELRQLCYRLFDPEQNINFVKEDLDTLLELLKERNYSSFFLKYLTSERTNGKCQRSEKLLNELIIIIKAILEIAEKEKNYENAKNSIILSQTFYYIINSEGKEKKIYLMDSLRDNEWIHSIKFWQEMIEIDIINNKFRISQENPGLNGPKSQDALKNIYFSSLLTYTHNMSIFNINKKDTIDLCLSLIERYKIDENMKLMLLNSIENIFNSKKKENENKEIKEKNNNINDIKEENNNNINIDLNINLNNFNQSKTFYIGNKNKIVKNLKKNNKKIDDDWVICNNENYFNNVIKNYDFENDNINSNINKNNNEKNDNFIDDFVIEYKNDFNKDDKKKQENIINNNVIENDDMDNKIILDDENNLNINKLKEGKDKEKK